MKSDLHLVEGQSLQRCVSGIARLVALAAAWVRYEPEQIADELVGCVFATLDLDLAHVRLDARGADAALEATQTSSAICWEEVQAGPGRTDNDIRVFSVRLGLSEEIGTLIVGARRPDFPHQTEELLLTIAASQAAIGFQVALQRADMRRLDAAHSARISAVRHLATSLVHDLNQPLAGIMTNASTGVRMLAADPPNVEGARETARRTIRDTHRASEIIGRLRALCDERPAAPEAADARPSLSTHLAGGP